MAINIFAEILQWSTIQPSWQRDALRRLFTVGTLTPTDLDALTEICKSAHGLAPASKKAVPVSAQHLPVGGPAAANAVSLIDLTHHTGVNALAPEQTVSFGRNLTIVYGENATGKSGYTRILKRACRSRFVEDVLGNVLGIGAPLKAKATIRINEGGTETPISWSPDAAPSPSLAQISVFDSHCVPVYLKDKTDVAFRPFGLDLFDRLASACAEVKKRLDAELQHLATTLLPALPGIMPGTKARQMLDSLTALTKEQDVRALATLSPAEEQRFKHLTELKRDLLASDPKKRAQELSAKAGRYEMLVTHVETLETAFGLEAMSKLGKARDKLRAARLALETLRKTALTPDHRSALASRSIVRRVLLSPPVVVAANCTVLQSATVHQLRPVGRLRVICRTLRLVSRAQAVVHLINQRGQMGPAVQPALFDIRESLDPATEGRGPEQASLFEKAGSVPPRLPDFLGTTDVLERFPGRTMGVLALHSRHCVVGPARVMHPLRSDWPIRVFSNPSLTPFEMVCRSASRDPRTATRLEQAVIAILAARSQEDADTIVDELRSSEYSSPVFQRLVNRLSQRATEPKVASRRWGQDECADALRARWIATPTGVAKSKRVLSAGYSWVGSLRWVGEQLLQRRRISRASPGSLRFFAAAVASARGWPVAGEQVVRVALEFHGLDAEVYRWTSAVALRAVLNNDVDETLLNALVPRAALWLSTHGNQHPIPPALLALRHLVNEKRQGPALLLLARIVSTRFKVAVRVTKLSMSRRGGSTKQSEEDCLDEMLVTAPAMPPRWLLPWGQRTDTLPFDYDGLENILTQYLGTGDPQIIWPILIDRHLLAAVLFSIVGHTLSARTQLGTRLDRDRWFRAESHLRGILTRRTTAPGPLWEWLGRQVADPEVERRLLNLIETPDPSVETATPVSLLRIQSSWALDLNRAGKGAQFRALRRVFDRPDLIQQHVPYWILQPRHRDALISTITRIARSNASIGEPSWRQVAEEVAREILQP